MIAAWALFAFAGRDRWAVAVLGGCALVNAAAVRPRFDRSHRAVDVAIAACLAYAAIQLVPLPPTLRAWLSPATSAVDRALLLVPPDSTHVPWRAISLDPTSTAWTLALALSVALTFWSARATFERGGALRATVRGIVWIGLALAVVTFVQRSTSPHLFYGIWKPIARTDTPTPLGPFLSRNDLATWLILAIPLAIGYAAAHIQSHARSALTGDVAEDVFDSRMMATIAAALLMTALLLASASRSGIVACGAGLLTLLALMRRRMSAVQFVSLALGLLAIAILATAYVNLPMLTARFEDVLAPDLGRGRIEVWRQVWPLARDFWQTGVGVGAFQRGMIVYERRPFELFINHAHDEYLQVMVEGGAPLLALSALAAAAAWMEARRRRRADRSPVAWMRAGAVAGIVALAVQSIWDTGVERPANMVLLSILAAVALHEAHHAPGATPSTLQT